MGIAIFYLERSKRTRQMNDVWLEQHKTEIMEEVLVQDRFDVMFKEYEQGHEDY